MIGRWRWIDTSRMRHRLLLAAVLCSAWVGGGSAASAQAAGPAASATAAWLQKVNLKLRRLTIYPREAGGREGVTKVSFTIDRQGNVVASRLVSGSARPALDQAALAMVLLASPLPPPPIELGEREC